MYKTVQMQESRTEKEIRCDNREKLRIVGNSLHGVHGMDIRGLALESGASRSISNLSVRRVHASLR